MRIRARAKDEGGTILVLSALSLVVLMVFAALTVDLGAAWAQRRQNQSAADAAVMAGGLNVIAGGGGSDLVIAKVQEFADKNLDPDVTATDWDNCSDAEVTSGAFVPLNSAITDCISVSVASETGSRILRVKIPTRNVDTFFARIIGIDTIATSAFAEAELDYDAGGGALPFVVPTGNDVQYCIGDVPGGLADHPCNGPQRGKFGDIDSPFHGTDKPGTVPCPGPPYPNLNTRLEWNVALGLDHRVFEQTDKNADPDVLADTCDAVTGDGYFPSSLKLGSGNPQPGALTNGFAGSGPYGTNALLPGRLRQGGGLGGALRALPSGGGPNVVLLDNVGLWEYLTTTGTPGSPDPVNSNNKCDGNHVGYLNDGSTATKTLDDCLRGLGNGDPEFIEEILISPRFALIPRLWLNQAQLDGAQPTAFYNIKEFVPVYVQTTFWNCSANECMAFRTFEDLTASDPSDDPQFFSPGEGDVEGCLIQGNGCSNNVNLSLVGVTAWVLDKDDVPADTFGGGSDEDKPIFVRLFR